MSYTVKITRGDDSTYIEIPAEEVNGRITKTLRDWTLKSLPALGSWNPVQTDFGEFVFLYIVQGTAPTSTMSDMVDACMLWWKSARYLKFTWKTEDENATSFPTGGKIIDTDRWWKDVHVNFVSLDYKESAREPHYHNFTIVLMRGERFIY